MDILYGFICDFLSILSCNKLPNGRKVLVQVLADLFSVWSLLTAGSISCSKTAFFIFYFCIYYKNVKTFQKPALYLRCKKNHCVSTLLFFSIFVYKTLPKLDLHEIHYLFIPIKITSLIIFVLIIFNDLKKFMTGLLI